MSLIAVEHDAAEDGVCRRRAVQVVLVVGMGVPGAHRAHVPGSLTANPQGSSYKHQQHLNQHLKTTNIIDNLNLTLPGLLKEVVDPGPPSL